MSFQAVIGTKSFTKNDLRHRQLQKTFVDYTEMLEFVFVSQNSIE